MLFRTLAFAAAVSLSLLGAVAEPVVAQTDAPAMTVEELMRASGLDEVFNQYGAGIDAALGQQGVPIPPGFQDAWSAAAGQVFGADAMHADLGDALSGRFTPEDFAEFGAFYSSDFGRMITEVERTVTALPPEGQIEARERGLALAGESDPRRQEQVDEMLALSSADIGIAMVRQTVRGLLIGMSLAGGQGDIEIPWEEIDAQLDATMPDIVADVAQTLRAVTFYTYRNVSEAELDRYLDFLRTDAAQRLYALVTYSVGQIASERMERFGAALIRHMSRVDT